MEEVSELVEVNRQAILDLENKYYLMSGSLLSMAKIEKGDEDNYSLYDLVKRVSDRLGDPVPKQLQESYDQWLEEEAEQE